MTLGTYIRNHRKENGLDQREFAREIGVDWHTVSGWENDYRNPNPHAIKRLCEALGLKDYRELLREVYGG